MLTAIVISILATLLPQLWVKRVINQNSFDIEELPGTGGELAEHLIKRFKLDDVSIEKTHYGNDHYDPISKTIRLSRSNLEKKSLSAISIAAHEFGHALQHHTGYKFLSLRTILAKLSVKAEKIASIILISTPLIAILAKAPVASAITLLAGLTIMGLPILIHLFTLKVELDASFNRALPIIIEGKYLPNSAIPIIKKILTAAALTYVSASLANLFNFYRWFAILRR